MTTPTKLPKRLTKARHAALVDLLRAINSEEVRSLVDAQEFLMDRAMPEWLVDWPVWSAGENMPGYMPDSPYLLFPSERAAKGYCRALEREPGGQSYVSDYMSTTIREVLT